jgi:hypothetical protein
LQIRPFLLIVLLFGSNAMDFILNLTATAFRSSGNGCVSRMTYSGRAVAALGVDIG